MSVFQLSPKKLDAFLDFWLQGWLPPKHIHFMKKALLVALITLAAAVTPLRAQQSASLSFSGPTTWTPGTSITLSVQDAYSGFGGGSWGSSYWLQVSSAVAPSLTITGLTYFPPFPNGYPGPFPILFNVAGEPGFTGEAPDLGAGANGLVPDGSYHITDITFALAANAPAGTYTLLTTTASPRGSIQVTSDFNDAPLPQASFVFTVVPEPSTLALIALAAASASIVAYHRRRL